MERGRGVQQAVGKCQLCRIKTQRIVLTLAETTYKLSMF
jgi:hypothetical protein